MSFTLCEIGTTRRSQRVYSSVPSFVPSFVYSYLVNSNVTKLLLQKLANEIICYCTTHATRTIEAERRTWAITLVRVTTVTCVCESSPLFVGSPRGTVSAGVRAVNRAMQGFSTYLARVLVSTASSIGRTLVCVRDIAYTYVREHRVTSESTSSRPRVGASRDWK